jgi:hypothetical protein
MLEEKRDDPALYLHPDTTLVAYAIAHVRNFVNEPA